MEREHRENTAATMLQALVRGSSVRREQTRRCWAAVVVQQCWRRWSAARAAAALAMQRAQAEADEREGRLRTRRLVMQQERLDELRTIPAAQVDAYMAQREQTAAVVVQAAWRRWRACAQAKQLREERMRTEAAVVLQRHWRGLAIRMRGASIAAAPSRLQATDLEERPHLSDEARLECAHTARSAAREAADPIMPQVPAED